MQTVLTKASKLAGLTLITLLFVTGCKTVSLNNFCDLYEPVYSRDTDRQELRDNINANNAVYLELCEEEGR